MNDRQTDRHCCYFPLTYVCFQQNTVIPSQTPKTALQVRRLSNSYQSLVSQAAEEIERLRRERKRMEMKQGKILQQNIQLTLKAKNLFAKKKLNNKAREVKRHTMKEMLQNY